MDLESLHVITCDVCCDLTAKLLGLLLRNCLEPEAGFPLALPEVHATKNPSFWVMFNSGEKENKICNSIVTGLELMRSRENYLKCVENTSQNPLPERKHFVFPLRIYCYSKVSSEELSFKLKFGFSQGCIFLNFCLMFIIYF